MSKSAVESATQKSSLLSPQSKKTTHDKFEKVIAIHLHHELYCGEAVVKNTKKSKNWC